jgi:hypothetical protein
VESPPHPLASLATSPRKRGEVEYAARPTTLAKQRPHRAPYPRSGVRSTFPS